MSSAPLQPPTAALDADGRIAIDAHCINCGYNLRTLGATAVCPECAHPVTLSIRGDFLCFAPSDWVRRLARGCLLILVALGVGAIGLVAWTAASTYLAITLGPSATLPNDFALLLTGGLIWSLATAGLAIAGLLLLTTREPGAVGRAQGASARRLIRIGLCVLPIGILLGLFARGLHGRFAGLLLTQSLPLGIVLTVIAGACWIIAFVILPLALLRHVMTLMKRIPRPGLVLYARITFWGLLVTMGMTAVSYAILIASMVTWSRTAFPAPTTAGTVAVSPATTLPSGSPNNATTINVFSYNAMSGQMSVSTAPATAPTAMAVPPPPFGPAFFIASTLTGLGGCGTFGLAIAVFILLILVQRALAGAARAAEQNAAVATQAAAQPPPPDHPT